MRKSLCLLCVCLLVGCSSSYQDGTYTGVYEEEKDKAVVELTIEDGVISACSYEEFDAMGKLKDETYGDDQDAVRKDLAKIAYKGFMEYPKMLVETQNVNDVDVISGATVSYKRFKEAVNDALKQAK